MYHIYLPILIDVRNVEVNSPTIKEIKVGCISRDSTLANSYNSSLFTHVRTRTTSVLEGSAPRVVVERECRVAPVHPSTRSGVHRRGKGSYARCPRFPNDTYRLRERWRECARGCCIDRMHAVRGLAEGRGENATRNTDARCKRMQRRRSIDRRTRAVPIINSSNDS